MTDTTTSSTVIPGHERRSRPARRAGVTPRAWSGREVVSVQPYRPCRRCRRVRFFALRALALAVVLGLAVLVYAPVAAFLVHLAGL